MSRSLLGRCLLARRASGQSAPKAKAKAEAQRACHLQGMKRSAEQVTAWQEHGHSFNSDIGHAVMREHCRLWSGMASAQKAKLEASAADLREERRCELKEQKDDLRAELRIRKDRLRHRGVGHNGSLSVSSCLLSARQRKEFDELARSPQWTASRVQQLRDEAAKPAGPPPPIVRANLEAIDLALENHKQFDNPPWLSCVCAIIVNS